MPTAVKGTPLCALSFILLRGPSWFVRQTSWCSQENGNVYVGIDGQFTVTPAAAESREELQEGAGEPQKGASSTATASLQAQEAALPLCRCCASVEYVVRRRRRLECRATPTVVPKRRGGLCSLVVCAGVFMASVLYSGCRAVASRLHLPLGRCGFVGCSACTAVLRCRGSRVAFGERR